MTVIGLAGRLSSGWTAPLWFDETFSAVIASQRSLPELFAWCRDEVGAPFYYLVAWAWAQGFGTEKTALRLPGLLFSLAAPALVLWRGHPDRRVRRLWAAALMLYAPGFEFASAARCYALLVLVGTGASIAFLRLLERPTTARAFAWTGLSALGVLTHYHYALVAGIQGLFFVALAPRAALRAWPALMPLVPVAAWMWDHWALLQRYSAGGSWYRLLRPMEAVLAFGVAFDCLLLGVLVPAVAAWWLACRLRGQAVLDPIPARDGALGWSGALALLAVVVAGLSAPSLSWRYAGAFAPALAFGGAVFLAAAARRYPLLPVAAVGLLAANGAAIAGRQVAGGGDALREVFNLDRPSAWLSTDRPPARTAFLWDNPAGSMSDPRRLGEVAGYFLRRHGRPDARVLILNAAHVGGPRALVTRAIRGGRADALIWIADAGVPATKGPVDAGLVHRLGWTCRDFGGGRLSVLACRKP